MRTFVPIKTNKSEPVSDSIPKLSFQTDRLPNVFAQTNLQSVP